MLSYNEKSLRKLQENEACFMDKLSDEDVYSSFMTIIGAARKFAKPETKVKKKWYIVIIGNNFDPLFGLCFSLSCLFHEKYMAKTLVPAIKRHAV